VRGGLTAVLRIMYQGTCDAIEKGVPLPRLLHVARTCHNFTSGNAASDTFNTGSPSYTKATYSALRSRAYLMNGVSGGAGVRGWRLPLVGVLCFVLQAHSWNCESHVVMLM
jgi:hypothetical protein